MRRIPLVRIFGIPVSVSASWFFVLFLSIYLLSGSFREVLGGSTTRAYGVAVVSVVLFFSSLLAHELGHALVARRAGIEIEGIDLWLLGGMARMRSAPQSPGVEARIALAGPAVNLLIVAGLFALGSAAGGGPKHFLDVAVISGSVHATPFQAVAGWLALINAIVLVFNLIPAYPLDGGQVAHAVAWAATGDRNRATQMAAQIGRAFGVALIAGGVLLIGYGNGWTLPGMWAALIGVFIAQTARGALMQGKVAERLRELHVADIMDPTPVTIPGETKLLDAQEDYFQRYNWPWFAVVDPAGHFLGLLLADRIDTELREGRPALTAAEVADDAPPWRIDMSATLETLVSNEGLRRLGAVIAVDSDGQLRGVVTLAHVRNALASPTGV